MYGNSLSNKVEFTPKGREYNCFNYKARGQNVTNMRSSCDLQEGIPSKARGRAQNSRRIILLIDKFLFIIKLSRTYVLVVTISHYFHRILKRTVKLEHEHLSMKY